MTAPTWQEVAEHGTGGRPLLVVHGNCQAEALRVLCLSAVGDDVVSVRVPPVFEVMPEQISDFHALMRRTTYLVTQPIVDDYRGLPLGSRQVAASLGEASRVVTVPVLRWAALHPTQAIVRAGGVGDPPVVPYHDLRVLAAAARGDRTTDLAMPSADSIREVARLTREHLRIRQGHHGTVDALSAFEAAGADACWTINHPQNSVLIAVARQALEGLGLTGEVADPGRVLLSTTVAPLHEEVLDALGLDGVARAGWGHQGRDHTEEEIAAIHLEWYRQHPQVVESGMLRHAETLRILGLD